MQITVLDVPEKDRYEALDGDTLLGVMTYQITGNIIAITHTETDAAAEGKGVGSTLARYAMQDALTRGRTVVPICPFLSGWLDRHHEYDQIVARQHRRVK